MGRLKTDWENLQPAVVQMEAEWRMAQHTQAAASQHTVASQFALNSAAAAAAVGTAVAVAAAAQPLMSAVQFVLQCEVRMVEGSLVMSQA